jgi:hypothetical protein
MKNGKPLFTKVDTGGATCCWFTHAKQWAVSRTKAQDASKAVGDVATLTKELAHPAVTDEVWGMWDGTQFVAQSQVSVQVLTATQAVGGLYHFHNTPLSGL